MAGKPVAASLCVRTQSKADRDGPLQRTEQVSPLWRTPQGLRGLAGLRDDAPSVARGAGGERAGRPCGARNKGDAARIDQVSALGRPRHRQRAAQPGLTSAVSTFNQAAWCPVRTRERGSRHTNGADPRGPAPLRRGIETAGDVAATCHRGSWRRESCRPWLQGRPARNRGRHAGQRWYGRSRMRGRRAGSERHRADRRASYRPS